MRPRPFEIVLDEDECGSFRVPAPGAEVACLAGSLWVTLEGDPEDHVLAAGESLAALPGGRLAFMALRDARVRLRSLEQAGRGTPSGRRR